MFRTAGSHPNRVGTSHAPREKGSGSSPRTWGKAGADSGRRRFGWGDGIAAGAALAVLAGFPTSATAAPCQYHQGKAKAECVKAHKAKAKRDAARWPAYPVTTRDLTARKVAIARWVRLGRCEAGHGSGYGGVRWNTPSGWRWQGGLGMYDRSHASTGHPYGSDAGRWNWQTQVLVGHRLMERYGITAWSAWRCW